VDCGKPAAQRARLSIRFRRWHCDPMTAKLVWSFRGNGRRDLDSMRGFYDEFWVGLRRPQSCIQLWKAAFCGAGPKNREFLGAKETLFQNVFTSIDPKTGKVTYAPTVIDHETKDMGFPPALSTEGAHNWHAMAYGSRKRRD